MRLSCPNCQTEYDVPDAALTGRPRTLRCALCGRQWQAGAPPPLPELAAPPRSIFNAQEPDTEVATLPEIQPAPPPPPPRPPPPKPQPAPPPQVKTARAPPPADPVATTSGRRKIAIPTAAAEEERKDRDALARLAQARLDEEANHRKRTPNLAFVPWLVSILILGLIIVAIWVERQTIMQIWPPSTRLFLAIQHLTGHS